MRTQTSPPDFADTDALIEGMIEGWPEGEHLFAGAVLFVEQGGTALKQAAYGYAELLDGSGKPLSTPRPMQTDSIFDLASVTKVAVTANLLALLFEREIPDLGNPIAAYLPSFARPDKENISVSDLLSHTSGLASWLPFYLFVDDGSAAVELVANLPNSYVRGSRRVYSDVNYIVLGQVIEAVTGRRLDNLFLERVAEPLGLADTMFLPDVGWRPRVVATSLGNRMEEQMCKTRRFPLEPTRDVNSLPRWRRHPLVGEVNDANCHLVFDGVSGHAGLFSSAEDLTRLARSVLDSIKGHDDGLLRQDTALYFCTPKVMPGQGLGWWTNRIDAFPGTFGHRGFTGTQLFIDPANDLITALLTNRVHRELPYPEPSTYTDPILASVYSELNLCRGLNVDPWLQR